MTDSYENIKNKTYTIDTNIKYSLAKTEPVHNADKSWLFSGTMQSVSTSRTDGQIKLRIAPREILDSNNIASTK